MEGQRNRLQCVYVTYVCLPARPHAVPLGDPHVVEDGEGLCQLGLQLDEAVRLLGGGPLPLGGGGVLTPLEEGERLGEILVQLRGLEWIYCLNQIFDILVKFLSIESGNIQLNNSALIGYCYYFLELWSVVNLK